VTGGGYDAFEDPYSYRNSDVLKNKPGFRDADILEAFELEMATLRSEEALPKGLFGPAHYRAIHRHLFQDVYGWAGKYRTVRTSKGGNPFCFPENIAKSMDVLFERLRASPFLGEASFEEFAVQAADFLAELNAIHAFREGNGRAQLSFLYLLAERAGQPLDLSRVRPEPMLAAMIRSYHGDCGPLVAEITRLRV
jgi:cell filamentation protein